MRLDSVFGSGDMRNEKIRSDAVLGYADEQHAYYIRLIENDAVIRAKVMEFS